MFYKCNIDRFSFVVDLRYMCKICIFLMSFMNEVLHLKNVLRCLKGVRLVMVNVLWVHILRIMIKRHINSFFFCCC